MLNDLTCDRCGVHLLSREAHDIVDCADNLADTVAYLKVNIERLESELEELPDEPDLPVGRMTCELRGSALIIWPIQGNDAQVQIYLSPTQADMLRQMAAGNIPVIRKLRRETG